MDRKWWTLLTECMGMLMLLLDITIVNVALPSIANDLGASFTDLQWTIDAYAVSLAAMMLVTGSLGDLLGHRRVFAFGLVVFTSRRCCAAWHPIRCSSTSAARSRESAAPRCLRPRWR